MAAVVAREVRSDAERVARRVELHSGIVFRPEASAFEIVLRDRLALGSWPGVADYATYLESPADEPELRQLVELLVVTETSLFRQPAQLEVLRTSVLPDLHRTLPGGETLRIWSAATASGEEAYSIAAVALATLEGARRVEVLGTDISRQALARARRAVYQERVVSNVPADYFEWAFHLAGRSVEPSAVVRSLVRLAQHNLARNPWLPPDPAGGHFHVIFCRNVLMYFAPTTVSRVVAGLAEQLLPGGLLFTGFAETLLDEALGKAALELVQLPGTFAYRRVERTSRPQPRAVAAAPSMVEPSGSSDRPSVAALLEQSRAMAASEGLGAALQLARQAARGYPTSLDAKVLLGVLASRAGLDKQARLAFEQATWLNPLEPLGWVYLGALLREAGETHRAAKVYSTAATLLGRLPPDQLVGEYAAGQLARMCRQQAEEL